MRDTDRIDSKTKKPRSKGYGFIQFDSHADALACLRWMNNNPKALGIAAYRMANLPSKKKSKLEHKAKTLEMLQAEEDKNEGIISKQRPIAEFSIENNLVLKKRDGRVPKAVSAEEKNKKESIGVEDKKSKEPVVQDKKRKRDEKKEKSKDTTSENPQKKKKFFHGKK